MRDLKVTIVQADLAWHDTEANLAHIGSMIDSIKEGADLIVLPEMFASGFTMHPETCASEMSGKAVAWMRERADGLGTDIAGSLAVREGGRFFNRLVWAKPGGTVITCDKRHLFRMAGEDRVYAPGAEAITVECAGWRIRPFICYDLRFPVWMRNAGNGYDVIVVVANWPESRSAHWKALLRARAIENQCYVIGANRVGVDGNGVAYSGGSTAIDYCGNVLFEQSGTECVSTVTLSRGGLDEYRESFPAWRDADRFSLE